MLWPFFFSNQPLVYFSTSTAYPSSCSSSIFKLFVDHRHSCICVVSEGKTDFCAAMLTRWLNSSVCELADNIQGSPASGGWERPYETTQYLIVIKMSI